MRGDLAMENPRVHISICLDSWLECFALQYSHDQDVVATAIYAWPLVCGVGVAQAQLCCPRREIGAIEAAAEAWLESAPRCDPSGTSLARLDSGAVLGVRQAVLQD